MTVAGQRLIEAAKQAARVPANDEMVSGYRDGFDLDSPEPSANRSHSYRHGFANGRADKTGVSRGLSVEALHRMADVAMLTDAHLSLAGERE